MYDGGSYPRPLRCMWLVLLKGCSTIYHGQTALPQSFLKSVFAASSPLVWYLTYATDLVFANRAGYQLHFCRLAKMSPAESDVTGPGLWTGKGSVPGSRPGGVELDESWAALRKPWPHIIAPGDCGPFPFVPSFSDPSYLKITSGWSPSCN